MTRAELKMLIKETIGETLSSVEDNRFGQFGVEKKEIQQMVQTFKRHVLPTTDKSNLDSVIAKALEYGYHKATKFHTRNDKGLNMDDQGLDT